ncbi:MAG: HAD hydrolase family protein [Planctomycetota bacterium]|nr:HAD hydrolase family protein [Planctomycetota bacterium]
MREEKPTPTRLLAIDLDGTLLNSSGVLAAPQLEACRLASKVCTIAVATGRRPRKVRELLAEFDFPYYLITNSGGRIEREPDGGVLFKRFHEPDILSEAVEQFVRNGLSVVFFCEETPDGDVVVLENDNPHPVFLGYVQRSEKYILRHISPGDPLPQKVHFISSIGEEEALTEVYSKLVHDLHGRFNMHLVRNISCDGAAFDVLPAGCSKWTALVYLADMLEISHDAIATIGDDANDLDMLANSTISIAMGNARREIAEVARHRTLRNDEDGVSYAIREILKLI